jgi:hypothetical protein
MGIEIEVETVMKMEKEIEIEGQTTLSLYTSLHPSIPPSLY